MTAFFLLLGGAVILAILAIPTRKLLKNTWYSENERKTSDHVTPENMWSRQPTE